MRRFGIEAVRCSVTLLCAALAFGLLASCATTPPAPPKTPAAQGALKFPAARLQEKQTVRLQALTVNMMARVGRVAPIALTVGPNEQIEMDVTVSESMAAGTGKTLRASLWKAAFNAARMVGRPLIDYSISLRCDEGIDGASLGALLVAGLVATMAGLEIKPKVSLTGSLLPDGTIGPVAGLPQKLAAAVKAGIKIVGYPVGLRNAVDLQTGETVDLEKMAIDLGAKAVEVSTLGEAVKLLTGKSLPQATPLPRPRLALTDKMRQRVAKTTEIVIAETRKLLVQTKERASAPKGAAKKSVAAKLETAEELIERAGSKLAENPSIAIILAQRARTAAYAAHLLAKHEAVLEKASDEHLAKVVAELRGIRQEVGKEANARRFFYQHSFMESHWNVVSYQLLIASFYFTMTAAKQAAMAVAMQAVLDGKPLTAPPPAAAPGAKPTGKKDSEKEEAADPYSKALSSRDKQEIKKRMPELLEGVVTYAALGWSMLQTARDYARVDLKGPDTAANQMPEIDESMLEEFSKMYIQASRANLVYYAAIVKDMVRTNQLPREEVVEQLQLAALAAGAWVIPDQVMAPQWGPDAPATAMVRLAGAKESWIESALLIYRAFYPTRQYERAHNKILEHGDLIVRRFSAFAEAMTGTVPMSTRLFYQAALDYQRDGKKLKAMGMYLRAALEADFSVILARVLGKTKKMPKKKREVDPRRYRRPSEVMHQY